MDKQQKTALVIGASRGLGKACALRLAHDGFEIVGTCRSDIKSLFETKSGIEKQGGAFRELVFDIADREQSQIVLREAFPDTPPDVIVYNAGIARDNLFAFMSGAEWDDVIQTNVNGFYNTVQPFVMDMMARRNGRIVVIASVSGQAGQMGQVNYSASKAALIGAVRALARETGRKGVLVNAVAPGFIGGTAMTKDLPEDQVLPLIPLHRTGTPEDVAAAVSFLCGPDSAYITGAVLPVNGGLYMS